MNRYIHLLALLLALPLSLPAQTIKDYVRNDWPDDRYQVHGDGTVTDTVTGLMWMQCSLGQDPNDNCSGRATSHSWQEALAAAEASTFATYSDWRLPNIKELSSLAARDRHDPAINSTIFPNASTWSHWSASPYGDSSDIAWALDFSLGLDTAYDRGDNGKIRLVRSRISISATFHQPPTSTLNDTGIDWGGDYDSGNNDGCSSNISAPQDCHQGRDATHNDDSDGHAGFSFTKLDSNGNTLAASATNWSCVQDNVTGLIWEVKTDDFGLHYKYDWYNWYNTDTTTNGGADGYAESSVDEADCYGYENSNESTYCNTQAFAARVNAAGLCGASDWRLPSREELRSIVDYSRYNPNIDTDYFPNTASYWFWSSSPLANDSSSAWVVDFDRGHDVDFNRDYSFQVRLVRSRP